MQSEPITTKVVGSNPAPVLDTGADPGFHVKGVHLKKLRRAEGDAKMFGIFRLKNHDFTQKNHIFLNLWGAPATQHYVIKFDNYL